MSQIEKILVSSQGYADAEIFFLAGYPLREDLEKGVALTGSVEKTLRTYLHAEKIPLERTYRACFIKEHLEYSGTNSKKLREALAKVDVKEYEQRLFSEIREVNPVVIVPLDDLALGVLFPYIHSIKKPQRRKFWIYCYRSSILPLREDWQLQLPDPIKIIPIIGPLLQYGDWSVRSYTQLDYAKVAKERLYREKVQEYGLIWVCRSVLDFNKFLERMFLKNPKRVTFDLEWTGGLISCISLCFDGYESISIPIGDKNIAPAERAMLWQRLAKVLNSPLEKNNQNIKEDWKVLEKHGFHVTNVTSDTMIKGSILYPELPKGLDFYTSIYTPLTYYKDEGRDFNPSIHEKDRFYLYNAKDSLAAHIVADGMDKELKENPKLDYFYHTELAPSILIYKNMDQVGIQIDPQVKQKLLDKYDRLYDSNENILRKLSNNSTLNARSWQQVGDLVYKDIGYPPRYKTSENGIKSLKTDKDTLDDLLINWGENTRSGALGVNILARVIMCRKLSKVREYINTPLYPDGRWRGTSNLAGTETGRSSSSKTLDVRFRDSSDPKSTKSTKRLGRSLQTISKHGFAVDEEIFEDFTDTEIAADIRSMFVPTKGSVFIEGDGNGAEARVVFVLAEDYEGLASMDQKPKIHAKTAAEIFGIDVNTITKDYPKVPKIGIAYYDLGKRVRHAGNYNMGAFRLAQMTHLTLAFCIDAINKFHSNNPKIRGTCHQEVIQQITKFKRLETPLGRRRDFFNRFSEELLKEAFAYIPQSVISDLTKFTMWRIVDVLPGYLSHYRFLAEMHDGILAEVKKGYEEEYMQTFKKIYERPINFNECSLPRDYELIVPVELAMSGENWMNLKEVHI